MAKEILHGKLSSYTNHKCRCGACREAWAVYRKVYILRRRERGLCVDCNSPSFDNWRCDKHALAERQRMRAYDRRKAAEYKQEVR